VSTDRLKHVNLYAGVFVLLAVVLLIIASFFVANQKGFWAGTFMIKAEIDAAEIDGLTVPSDVVFLGQNVGTVTSLDYSDERAKRIQIWMKLRETVGEIDVRRKLDQSPNRPDGPAILKKQFEIRLRHKIMGDAFLEFVHRQDQSNSEDTPVATDERSTDGHQRPDGISDVTAPPDSRLVKPELAMADQVRDQLRAANDTFTAVKDDFNEMTADVKLFRKQWGHSLKELELRMQSLDRSIQLSREDIHEIRNEVAQFQKNSAAAMKRVSDDFEQIRNNTTEITQSTITTMDRAQQTMAGFDQVADEAEIALRQIQKSTSSVDRSAQQLATDVGESTQRLNRVLESTQVVADALRRESRDLPGTVRKTHATLDSAQEVMEGMRNNFLVRPFIYTPTTSRTVIPAEIGR
jgi:ABC-type transporter Mla subunit MlaD